MSWAAQYVGLPYVKGARGPHAFDCWGLVQYVQKLHFGRTMPEVATTADDLRGLLRDFAGHVEHERWKRVDIPIEGDCIEMGSGLHPAHIGIWVNADGGGVLHAVHGKGVVFSRDSVARSEWPLFLTWRFVG